MAQAVERGVGLVGLAHRNRGRLFIPLPLLLLEEINLKVTSVHRLVLAGLPYTEESLVESYAQALRHLHAIGAPLR
jgi:hypothetical protein